MVIGSPSLYQDHNIDDIITTLTEADNSVNTTINVNMNTILYYMNVISKLNPANEGSIYDFCNYSCGILSGIYNDPSLAKIGQTANSIKEYLNNANVGLSSIAPNLTREANEPNYDDISPSSNVSRNLPPAANIVTQDIQRVVSQPTKPETVTDQKQEEINQRTALVNKSINNPSLIEFLNTIKRYSTGDKFNYATSILTSMLENPSQIKDITPEQVKIIENYKNKAKEFRDIYRGDAINNIQTSIAKSESIMNDGNIKESKLTFKSFLLNEADDVIANDIGEVIGPVIKSGKDIHQKIKTSPEIIDLVTWAFEGPLGYVILLILPEILDFLLKTAPKIVSQLLFPLGAFTGRIIVVGNPAGIDPSKDIESTIENVVNVVVNPVRSFLNTIQKYLKIASIAGAVYKVGSDYIEKGKTDGK